MTTINYSYESQEATRVSYAARTSVVKEMKPSFFASIFSSK